MLRDAFLFSEVAIKVVLRAKGEGTRRGFEGDEPADGVMADDGDDEAPIVRAPRRQPQPAPEPPVIEEPAPRPRKKPRGSETWDF